MQAIDQFILRCLLIILTASLTITSARHLGDDNLEENNQSVDLDSNQLGFGGLKPWEIELLAQKLAMAELNNNQLRYPGYVQDPEARLKLADILYPSSGFQRNLRSSNKNYDNRKRGSKCFFNAVSCFGKK